MTCEDFYDDRDQPVPDTWWDSIEEMDAREEAEHGPERAQSWKPEWVRLRDRITYSRDEKSGASSAESQEAQY